MWGFFQSQLVCTFLKVVKYESRDAGIRNGSLKRVLLLSFGLISLIHPKISSDIGIFLLHVVELNNVRRR